MSAVADSHRFNIDGTSPGRIERAASPDAVAEVLAMAAQQGLGVAPVGGGGALALGNPIKRYDVALDMRGVDRILDHQPTDLVVSVEAGVTLAEIDELLGRHGQWLSIEAPCPERATIGGLIATALTGPGRHVHGSLRDSLIGIAVASPTGGIAKAGGMVVKNVSGFDLMRLHHGALGTLGVIVSANFKVLPRPPDEATVLVDVEDLDQALSVVDAAAVVSPRATVSVIDRDVAGAANVAIRTRGRSAHVTSAASETAATIGRGATVLASDESAAWWRRWLDRLGTADDTVEVRIGCPPSGTAAAVSAIDRAGTTNDISGESLNIWPQLGQIILRLPATVVRHEVDAILAAAEEIDATWRIARAPLSLKRHWDVWGPAPAALDTTQRLKAQFDPSRTLNPGRFIGYL